MRDLGDGLILRSARLGDGADLVEFNATMHADDDLPAAPLADWTRDLFDTPHPTFSPERDVTVVEDTGTGRIVSALFLIPQVWSYDGVPIKTGQPELIATHPDYRRRGLVRAQFEVIHEWSHAAGQVWQFISGIPWYYRQFGYTYALDLPPAPILWSGATTPAAPGELTLRPATPADVAFIAEVEMKGTSGTTLGVRRGPEGFALELARRPGGLLAGEVFVIESAGATPVGYVAHQRRLDHGVVSLRALEVRPGTEWLGPTAAVVAHLHEWLRAHPDGPGRGVRFALPSGHPAIRCAARRLGAGMPGSYGLYVRVPDLVAFLQAVGPVLERRLASSPAVAWTGDLRIGLYEEGLRLRFDKGRLGGIERWSPAAGDAGGPVDALLPRDDFLHLLLGNRTIADLERTVADCLLDTDAGALLLDVLFPPMPTSRWEFG